MPSRNHNDTTIQKIHESFRPHVKEVLKNFHFGLNPSKPDIELFDITRADNIPSPDYESTYYNLDTSNRPTDHFIIYLPYAGDHLKWEVLFDAGRPWLAPDFRFNDETFLINVDTEYIEKNVPSLAKWNYEDVTSLNSVLKELIQLYRQRQLHLLGRNENSKAFFEYTTLVGNDIINENNVEIMVFSGERVTMLIKLKIDCSQLPSVFSDNLYENPGNEWAILLIKYPNPARLNLLLSPLLDKIPGLELPDRPIEMIDYVPKLIKEINNKIMTLVYYKNLTRQFLCQLIAKYENAVLEHDSTSASFLFDVEDFYCILHVKLISYIPSTMYQKSPINLTLRSVYCTGTNEPLTRELVDFHKCPIEQILSRFDSYTKMEILNLKSDYNGKNNEELSE